MVMRMTIIHSSLRLCFSLKWFLMRSVSSVQCCSFSFTTSNKSMKSQLRHNNTAPAQHSFGSFTLCSLSGSAVCQWFKFMIYDLNVSNNKDKTFVTVYEGNYYQCNNYTIPSTGALPWPCGWCWGTGRFCHTAALDSLCPSRSLGWSAGQNLGLYSAFKE